MPFINCADATLDTYIPSSEKPWNEQRAMHLFRRIQTGASHNSIKAALTADPSFLIDQLVDQAVSLPLTTDPEWAYWTLADYDTDQTVRNEQIISQVLGLGFHWMKTLKNDGLRDRMSWFWHNHFVTRLESYGCPSWMFQYYHTLQKHAVGNFKEFVRDIGLTPAMLIYLNNIQNTRFDINENYARELYELFTLGLDNGYTQTDIVETARAITGWNGLDVENLCGEVTFLPVAFDDGVKTIFGQTGYWDYNDVIDLLFDHRAEEVSVHICGKLYRHFVNPKVDEQIVEELATVMRNNNWEMAPVLKILFKSEHFFEEAHIGTVIPGHLEYFLTFLNELDYEDQDDLIYNITYSADEFDQRIFNPTDVSGWPGNRAWINSVNLQYRWDGIQRIMGYYYNYEGMSLESLRNFVIELVGVGEKDPKVITDRILNYFLPKGLQNQLEYDEALKVFKGEVPENYFTEGQWSLLWEYAPAQIYYLLVHLSTLPEFQLR